MICPHCEKPMVQAKQDIVSPSDSTMVLVHKSQYYCQCGLIQDPSEEQQLIRKRQEKRGPKIGKGKDSLPFESIRFDQEPGRPKDLVPDPEQEEKERLEADNCTVIEERITSADSGRSIVKRYR